MKTVWEAAVLVRIQPLSTTLWSRPIIDALMTYILAQHETVLAEERSETLSLVEFYRHLQDCTNFYSSLVLLFICDPSWSGDFYLPLWYKSDVFISSSADPQWMSCFYLLTYTDLKDVLISEMFHQKGDRRLRLILLVDHFTLMNKYTSGYLLHGIMLKL